MKKLFAILLAAILCLGLLAGCGQTTIIVNMGGEDDTPDATPTPEVVPTDPPADTPAPVVDDTPPVSYTHLTLPTICSV